MKYLYTANNPSTEVVHGWNHMIKIFEQKIDINFGHYDDALVGTTLARLVFRDGVPVIESPNGEDPFVEGKSAMVAVDHWTRLTRRVQVMHEDKLLAESGLRDVDIEDIQRTRLMVADAEKHLGRMRGQLATIVGRIGAKATPQQKAIITDLLPPDLDNLLVPFTP